MQVFEADGFVFSRVKDDHIIMRKPSKRSIVIPKRKEVEVYIIQSNLKTAGISRERYFQLLKSVG